MPSVDVTARRPMSKSQVRPLPITQPCPASIPRQIAQFPTLRAMPILEPEPAHTNELARVVRYDLEPPPQGTSRKQQVIGSYRRTPAVQARTQLRRHTGIFALERQDGD